MLNHPYDLHENDRKAKARELGLSLQRFDELLESGNKAHAFIVETGPFHGQEDLKEPNFRITAEPAKLPKGSKKILTDLGNDLIFLGKVIPNLPQKYQDMMGWGLDMRIPVCWRIDSILDKDGKFKINEIEGIDSASALMMAEQLAYNLQPIEETTVAKLVAALDKMNLIPKDNSILNIAILRNKLATNPFTPNARRLIEWIRVSSKGKIDCELFDIDELREGVVKPDWSLYEAVIPEAYVSPEEMEKLGIAPSKLLTSGNYNALVNKGLLALMHMEELKEFWTKELGEDRYKRLKDIFINSKFIKTAAELDEARAQGDKVVKITWGDDMYISNGSRGVAVPAGDVKQSSDERWELLKTFLDQGYIGIAQDYIEPAKIQAYLRKRGTTLEPVQWYNRICVKYVVDGDPNGKDLPNVSLTATEITLGPDVVPAGRQCAYTAGALE